jgi:1,4-alpha-glucan branching enzyme
MARRIPWSGSGSDASPWMGLILIAALLCGCATMGPGPVSVDEGVRFSLEAPHAGSVSLVIMKGPESPTKVDLDQIREKTEENWVVVVDLPPGEYRYFFLVDGEAKFDPAAPRLESDDFGGTNGVFLVERDKVGKVSLY